MSKPDAFQSNGTCYYANGEQADDVMIPCGNSAYGHIQCCQAEDNCLSSLACFNPEFGVTYLAGCTDESYEDDNCPDKKGHEDQPWAGLVYCNGTSNEWVACEQDGKESTLTSADACWCPEDGRTVAFEDAATLTNMGVLPASTGAVVDWEKEFYPTDKTLTGVDPNETNGPSDTGDGNSSSPTEGPPEGPPDSTTSPDNEDTGGSGGGSSGLSKGGKIGVGVGVSLAAVLIFAALALLFLRRRKEKKKADLGETATKSGDPRADLAGGAAGVSPITNDGSPSTPSELESRAARPWSMRSELQTPDTPMSMADRAEADSPALGEKIGGHQFQGQSNLRPTDVPTALRPAGGPPSANAGGNQGQLPPVAELPG